MSRIEAPANWPPLQYLMPVRGYTGSISSATNSRGDIFFAIVVTPRDAKNKEMQDDQFCAIVRAPVTGPIEELKRYTARESASWLLSHGADPKLDQGKYGDATIAVSGDDIVVALSLRVNGLQTAVMFRERGLAA